MSKTLALAVSLRSHEVRAAAVILCLCAFAILFLPCSFFFIPSSHVEDDSNRYLGFLLDKLALSIYTDAILPFLSCLSLFQTQFAFSRFSDLGNAVDCIKQVNFSTQFLVHRHFKYRVVKVKLMIILIKTPRQLSKIFLYR